MTNNLKAQSTTPLAAEPALCLVDVAAHARLRRVVKLSLLSASGRDSVGPGICTRPEPSLSPTPPSHLAHGNTGGRYCQGHYTAS